MCNKPLYSKEEVQNIVNRLYQKKDSEGRCPPLVKLDKTRTTFPAEIVDKIIDIYGSTNRLCMKPRYRNRTRDQMYAQKLVQDLQQTTEEDVDAIVNRLNHYNVDKWPPNSKGYPTEEPSSPEPVLYPPNDSNLQGKEIDEVVERLYNGRWKSPTYEVDSVENGQDDNTEQSDRGEAEDHGYQSEEQVSERGEQEQEET